jgi:4-diphosphocytidyl-2-C-methyl-D-erythritol kinase
MLNLPSYAKINWTLEVLGRRPDGYHELRTLLQSISLADELRFTPLDHGIEIVTDSADVPADERNLAYRAASLLSSETGSDHGIRIELIKHIPVAAGLGGGSSNAAITLLALQRLWRLDLSVTELCKLGARLGADVPFFLIGGTCLGVGRGDEIHAMPDMEMPPLLLVNVGLALSTQEVYRNLPPELTAPAPLAMMPFTLEAANRAMTAGGGVPSVCNDLLLPVVERYPILREVLERLVAAGASVTSMAGSGSTLFAIFEREATLIAAQGEMRKHGWWCVQARAIGRKEYQAAVRAM